MAASVQFRPQNRDLGMVMREVDEDLAIFLGIRNVENDHLLVQESDVFDDPKSGEAIPDSLLAMNASQADTFMVADDDNFLNLEMEKSDDNWLLTQPDTSLLPSVETNVQDSATSQMEIPNNEVALKSEPENTSEEASVDASLSDTSSKVATSSDDRKPTRREATPSGRQPSLPARPKPSRSSTPTSRPTLPSSKSVSAQPRSSPLVGPVSRSSAPASRPSPPITSKSTPRSSTPTRKPATPTVSALDRSSSSRKAAPAISKSLGASRGTSPTVKLRPSKATEMLSVSQNAPQNPKISVPKRPVSASRGRTSGPVTRSSSLNEKPTRKSCSPPKVRAPISAVPYRGGSKLLSRSRNGDDVNPVVMGTKMVDRVVNMRKLAPPKQDEYVSDNTRKSSQENSGFGRSLSKKSLDMAIRHMDIRRSIREKPRASG